LISFSLITFCAVRSRSGGKPGLVLQLLESKIAVWLGVTSYSLYLVHTPIIAAGHLLLTHQGIPARYHLVLLGTVGVAVSVLAGWLFHIGVEQWFIPKTDPRRIPTHSAPVITAVGQNAL
jgi:peptidoglycan/LPS O-acetylase OafA/YrhL